MTTVGDMVQAVQRMVYGSSNAILQRLAANVTLTDTEVSFTFPLRGLATGSVIAVDDEMMYVYATDANRQVVHVVRGYRSDADTHTSGTFVEINPRFPPLDIKRALKEEMASWPDDIFVVDEVEIAGTASNDPLDAGDLGDFIWLLEAHQKVPGALRDSWPTVKLQVHRGISSAEFPSGVALNFSGVVYGSATYYVTYARRPDLTDFRDNTDLLDDLGLPNSMADVAQYGAAWRLVGATEIARGATDVAGESRLASEVPPGARIQTGQVFYSLRNQRLAEEARRLRGRFPFRY